MASRRYGLRSADNVSHYELPANSRRNRRVNDIRQQEAQVGNFPVRGRVPSVQELQQQIDEIEDQLSVRMQDLNRSLLGRNATSRQSLLSDSSFYGFPTQNHTNTVVPRTQLESHMPSGMPTSLRRIESAPMRSNEVQNVSMYNFRDQQGADQRYLPTQHETATNQLPRQSRNFVDEILHAERTEDNRFTFEDVQSVRSTTSSFHTANRNNLRQDQFMHRSDKLNVEKRWVTPPQCRKELVPDYKNVVNFHTQPDLHQTDPYVPETQMRNPQFNDPTYFDYHQPPTCDFNPSMQNLPYLQMQMMSQMSKMIARQSEADLWVFDGSKLLDYPLFKKRFCTIYQEGGYSAGQGVAKLDKYIQGEARKLVDVALKTAADPESIFMALDKVYGRTDALKREMKRKIENLSYVQDWNQFKEYSCVVKNIHIATQYLRDVIGDTRPFMEKLIVKLAPHLATQFGAYCTEKHVPENQETLRHLADWVDSMNRITNIMLNATWDRNDESQDKRPETKTTPLMSSINKKCSACNGDCKTLETCNSFINATYTKRRKMLDDAKACFICLGYHKGRCHKAKQCGTEGCTKFHHKMLHKDQTEEQKLNMNELKVNAAILKFVPVTIAGPLGKKNVLAFMDDGSTGTLIEEKLADELGLEGKHVPLMCKWTDDQYKFDAQSRTVTAKIKGLKRNMTYYDVQNLRTIKELGLPAQEVNWKRLQENFPYTKNADVSMHDERPRILIGQSNAHLLRVRASVQPSMNQPSISRTVLGWVLHGPVSGTHSDDEPEQTYCCKEIMDEELHEAVKAYFKLEEAMSTRHSTDVTRTEQQALDKARQTIEYDGERFVVGLPWKNEVPELPNSYGMAMRRLLALEKKLQKDPELANKYEQEMQKLLDKKYAVEVSREELNAAEYKWYLPHFYVRNPNKPNKIRVVFDAAAKVAGVSLNSQLLPGPDLLTSLFGNLLRFREFNIAWAADIEEMFNQVRIQLPDTYAQLYLWRSLNNKISPRVYRMQAMLFGLTSSPFLSQFVKNYNADGFEDEYPQAAQEIRKSFYVDDWLSGTNDLHEAIRLVNEVNVVQSAAGFRVRNYMSNSPELLKALPTDLIIEQNAGKILQDDFTNRVLGILWNANTDEMSFSMSFHKVNPEVMNGTIAPTKRQVLSAAMSLFDPLGLLSPYTVKARVLLQKIWRQGIHWDDQIKGDVLQCWFSWLEEMKQINELKLPRLYANNLSTAYKCQMHVFSDAGEDAYSSSVYLRIDDTVTVKVCLIAAKAKVCPLKTSTVPRLELQAALMGTRMASKIETELNCRINETYFWTDSKTVILWLRSEKPLQSFVANRVNEILDRSNVNNWRWVPTRENPADICTRIKKKIKMDSDHMWFKGPDFLLKNEDEWPRNVSEYSNGQEMVNATIELTYGLHVEEPKIPLPQIKFNYGLAKLLRITGYLRQIIFNFKHKTWKHKPLTVSDLDWAEKMWIRKVQTECFLTDVQNVKSQKKNTTGRLAKTPLFIDVDGILKVKNRLKYSQIVQSASESQIVLDGDHPFTQLLILQYHLKYKHQFFEATVNDLMQKYKIPHIRAKVSKVVSKCRYCRRMKASPSSPSMGPIPDSRLQIFKKPFSCCGIDYFGPLLVKQGRSVLKRYGVLFCCMTTRAIHLELASDLSADSCINAVRRMMCRRGKIETMFSDNGTNFKGATRELTEALKMIDYDAFQEFLIEERISWKFNPPYAPTFGGAWERLVGVVKAPLKQILEDRAVSEDTLLTALIECEYIANSRPLTFVTTKEGNPTAISPNDLLIQQNVQIGIPGMFDERDLKYGKQWRAAQSIADQFWRRFLMEYLNTLKVPKKWNSEGINLEEGEVVYVANNNVSRLSWPLGLVVKVSKGSDGQVRVAQVRLANGKVVLRNARQLYPLKVRAEESVTSEDYVEEAPQEISNNTGAQNVVTERNLNLSNI